MKISLNIKGFTLIELMMVILMLALVIMSVYSLYSTSQRSAYTQDEIVEVQQNLRIAMDFITRDLWNAGMLISNMHDSSLPWTSPTAVSDTANSYTQPVGLIQDNSINSLASLPVTTDSGGGASRVHADMLTLNSCSPTTFFASARITSAQTGIAAPFLIDSTHALNNFNTNDLVRIYNPTWHDESTNVFQNPQTLRMNGGKGTIFQVQSAGSSTIQLVRPLGATDNDPTNTKFQVGDIIMKIFNQNTATTTISTIQYCLGSPTMANCNTGVAKACNNGNAADQTLCLVRITDLNTGDPQGQVIASKISGLQFTYLLDDGTEVPSTFPPSDLSAIRGIRVTLTGQTANAVDLSTGATLTTQKQRTLTTVVRLQNRYLIR